MTNKMPIVSIVGRPNVGKSTLFNRLVGKKQAIVAKEAGTTRDLVSGEVSWNNKQFVLLDTAGIINDFFGFPEAEIEKLAQDKIEDALLNSTIILFIVDARAGLTPEDKRVAAEIRKHSKKVIVVWNKADNENLEKKAGEANELGFSNIIPVSSQNGRRTGLLLDEITENFSAENFSADNTKKIAIIGRPNAGKSTLFNLITNSDHAIVSNIPGTTRDAVKLKIRFPDGDKDVEIIDTAGFRKRGKIKVGIEKFSIIRAVESVYSSDIVLLVVDASEGFTRTDAHLAELAISNRKKLIIVINKIDLLETRSTEDIKAFSRYKFMLKNPIIAISSLTQENLSFLFDKIVEFL